jgi:hypothetical protein
MALRYDALRVRVGGIRASDRGESGDEAGVAERQTEAGDGIVVLASVSDSRASHFHLANMRLVAAWRTIAAARAWRIRRRIAQPRSIFSSSTTRCGARATAALYRL